jgi:hypothetical protein
MQQAIIAKYTVVRNIILGDLELDKPRLAYTSLAKPNLNSVFQKISTIKLVAAEHAIKLVAAEHTIKLLAANF